LQSSELQERMAGQGADIAVQSSAAYADFVAGEAARWKQVVQAASIPPE
jgi:tripartite-type tricarboxylate transporter receptor subunit TctC